MKHNENKNWSQPGNLSLMTKIEAEKGKYLDSLMPRPTEAIKLIAIGVVDFSTQNYILKIEAEEDVKRWVTNLEETNWNR